MNNTSDYCPVKDARSIGHTPDTCTFCLKADRDMWRREAETTAASPDGRARKTLPPLALEPEPVPCDESSDPTPFRDRLKGRPSRDSRIDAAAFLADFASPTQDELAHLLDMVKEHSRPV